MLKLTRFPVEVDRSSTITYGTESNMFQVYGVQPDYQLISNIVFTNGNGRFLNQRDMEMNRKVIVLTKKVATTLFKKENPVGKYVKVDGLTFQVIGVDMKTSFDNEAKCYMPLETAQKLYNLGSDVSNINISVIGAHQQGRKRRIRTKGKGSAGQGAHRPSGRSQQHRLVEPSIRLCSDHGHLLNHRPVRHVHWYLHAYRRHSWCRQHHGHHREGANP